jgi:hypothetical protein
MGGADAGVKSTDVESWLLDLDSVSNKLCRNVLWLHHFLGYLITIAWIWMGLGKAKRRHKRVIAHGESRSRTDEPPGEGGSEEAANFIAEMVASLTRLARRHDLDLVAYLLAMTQLEAEDQVKILRRRKLS